GADGYLTEPHPAVTTATIRALLRAREAEDARRESEAQYRELFEDNPLPSWVVDVLSSRIVAVNDAAIRHYGYARDEFLRLRASRLQAPEERARPARTPDEPGTWRYVTKDGSVVEAEVTSRRLRYDGRDAQLVIASDVTERTRGERRRATQFA